MAFFNSAVTVLQTLVIALGAGLGIWGAINLLEGYGNDIRVLLIVQALCVWERDWQAQLFLRPVPVFP